MTTVVSFNHGPNGKGLRTVTSGILFLSFFNENNLETSISAISIFYLLFSIGAVSLITCDVF